MLHLITSAIDRRDLQLAKELIAFARKWNLLTFDEWVEVGYLYVAYPALKEDR